jgi:hypothetical protein
MLSCGDTLGSLDLDIMLIDQPFHHISYECETLKVENYFAVANPTVAAQLKGVNPQ